MTFVNLGQRFVLHTTFGPRVPTRTPFAARRIDPFEAIFFSSFFGKPSPTPFAPYIAPNRVQHQVDPFFNLLIQALVFDILFSSVPSFEAEHRQAPRSNMPKPNRHSTQRSSRPSYTHQQTPPRSTSSQSKPTGAHQSTNTPPPAAAPSLKMNDQTATYLKEKLKVNDPFDPCALLNLSTEESKEKSAVDKAYRRAALIFHPDRNKDPEAEEAFKVIKAAHELLTEKLEQASA